ncbi:DoxX family membrane protein [Streptomyces sp. SID8354]|nr:DoxX family membrane protein [Streptomyces sp. SID8354]
MNRIPNRLPPPAEPAAAHTAPAHSSAPDWGLLLIRLTLGLLTAAHGSQKLFGLFGGNGLSATDKAFASLGYRPGKVFALIGSLSEFLGGLGLAAGLLTPLAAAALIGVMINAVATVTGVRRVRRCGRFRPVLVLGAGRRR